MATQSNIFAFEIPRTEEPDGLQSIGSQRVRHDWVTKQTVSVCVCVCVCVCVQSIKNPPANAGDTEGASLIPGVGISSGERNGNLL